MRRGIFAITTAGTISVATGCANFREYRTSVSPTLTDLISNVECDLTSGVNHVRADGYDQINQWNAIISFTLQADVQDKGELVLAVVPPTGTGLLSLGANASALQKATSKRFVDYALPFRSLPNTKCDISGRELKGTVGAGLWLRDVITSFSATQQDGAEIATDFAPPKSLSTTTKFLIQYAGNAGPTFSLVPIGDSIASGSAKASEEWSKSHEITITMSPPVQKPSAAKRPSRAKAPPRISRRVSPADLENLEKDRTQFILQELLSE